MERSVQITVLTFAVSTDGFARQAVRRLLCQKYSSSIYCYNEPEHRIAGTLITSCVLRYVYGGRRRFAAARSADVAGCAVAIRIGSAPVLERCA